MIFAKLNLVSMLTLSLCILSFSQQDIPKDTQITSYGFPGSLYFGVGVPYKITISANGEVVLQTEERRDWENGKTIPGKVVKGRISRAQLRELISEFERIDFFSFKDSYTRDKNCVWFMEDCGQTETSITINGRTKKVLYNCGCRGPKELEDRLNQLNELEKKIDEVVNTTQLLE